MNDRLVLGADIGGTSVKYIIVDASRNTVAEGSVATDPSNAAVTFAALAEQVRTHLGETASLSAIGLACAGIVDPVQGTLGRAPNLPGWEQCDLHSLLESAFGSVAFALANDVNGALVGEQTMGAGRGCRDLLMLALGTGVGGGVMIGNKLVVGTRFGAAELGHVVLDRDGPLCCCGNAGCLEAYAGAVGIVAAARRRLEKPGADPELSDLAHHGDLTPQTLATLATSGCSQAAAIFHEAGLRLGQAIGGFVNTLDPERVIIGGGVALAGDLILGPCRSEAARTILCERSKSIPIVPAELGPRAAAVGAAILAEREVATR